MSSAVEQGRRSLTPEASKALGAQVFDSAAMAELRAKAAAAVAELPLPTPRERPWKYLDLTSLDVEQYQPSAGANGAAPPAVDGDYAAVVRQVNGETVSVELRAEGLQIVPFERTGDEKLKELIDKHYGTAVAFDQNKLTALHYAFERGGLLIHAAPNAEITQPIRIVRSYEGKQLAAPHTLVVTGENVRLSIIEEYQSDDADILALPGVELLPGAAAQLKYSALHRWSDNTQVFVEQRTVTERDAELVSLSVSLGGRVVKSHIESSLVGRGSSSELLGLDIGRGQQQTDVYTLQNHIGPDTVSDLLWKSALKEESRGVYYGITRVGPEARNASANQEDRNLLLSKTARADSDPVLEILTSNVIRASHGATAGPVDQEQLFYMQTRAMPHEQAEALLVHGFVGQVLDRIPDEKLRDEIADAIDAQLAK